VSSKIISPLVLATRRSPLALRQAALARKAFTISKAPWPSVELLELTTTGDKQKEWVLANEGGKGLFTRELEEALLDGRANAAIHSAKDLPTTLPGGLVLAGFLPRADPRDVLIHRLHVEIPKTVASGSPRRRAQSQPWWPTTKWVELRGNVETRLGNIAQGMADATFLAAAGLARLGIASHDRLVFEPIPVEKMVPAAGQGAIAIECRTQDAKLFEPFLCKNTAHAVLIERAVIAALGGGCHSASAAHFDGKNLHVFHAPLGRAQWPLRQKKTSAAENEALALVHAWLKKSPPGYLPR